jgi:hypothetical protein
VDWIWRFSFIERETATEPYSVITVMLEGLLDDALSIAEPVDV